MCGGLHFEQAQYVAEIFYQSIEKVVKVTAITNNVDDELEYSLSTTKSSALAPEGC